MYHLGAYPAVDLEVQRLLNAAGASPPLDVDGLLGPLTTAAVRSFQASHGLTPDGIPGTQTLAALRSVAAPATTPSVGPGASSSSGMEIPWTPFVAVIGVGLALVFSDKIEKLLSGKPARKKKRR